MGNCSSYKYERYYLCAFMNKICLFGGHDDISRTNFNTCMRIDTKNYQWKEFSGMNERRYYAACAVYRGEIVVSGGECTRNVFRENFEISLGTNEMYDHAADSWTDMPDMINTRCSHQLLARKNKLFVFGGYSDTIEVYDSKCNTFTAVKPSPVGLFFCKGFLAGNEFFVFYHGSTTYSCYDVKRDCWSENESKLILNFNKFTCVQVLCLK